MRKPAASSANFLTSKKPRALFAAAFLAFGFAGRPAHAQVDLAALRAKADQDDPEALNALANAYANGQGVAQNLPEALRLYQRAADRGHAPAQFNLGMMNELGRGVAPDLATAFKYYLKAAEQGFAPAQFNVGNMYANGVGVKQDFFEAALWFRQAADRGVPEAQYNLALAYELGRGLGKDEMAAQSWYRKAADQGYTRARYNLALMLEEGRGSPSDPAAAAGFYRAAALQNFAPAQNNLGILLAEGRGMPADLSQAYAWLVLAVDNGAKPTGRDIVAQQLTSSQLADANIAVARLRAQIAASLQPAAATAVASAAPAPATTAAPAGAPGASSPDLVALTSRVVSAQADLEKLRTENSRLAAAAQSLTRDKAALEQRLAAADAAAKTAGDAAALSQRLAAAQGDLDNARAENARLTDAAQAAQRDKSAFEQRAAAAEAALAAKPVAPASDATVASLRRQLDEAARAAVALRSAKEQAEQQATDLAAQLKTARDGAQAAATAPAGAPAASDDQRVARLQADNLRLNDEVKRSTIQLSMLDRQLRTMQEKLAQAGGNPAAAAAASADAGKVADLTRQVEELRTLNERLAADNVRASGAAAPAPGGADLAPQLAAAQARATKAEQSLTDSEKARGQLTAEKATLEKRVAQLAAAAPAPVDAANGTKLQSDLTQALQEHGVEIRVSCEQGVCGTCITRVLEGECDHRDLYFTDEEKAKNDQFTPCCSRAKGKLLVLDL